MLFGVVKCVGIRKREGGYEGGKKEGRIRGREGGRVREREGKRSRSRSLNCFKRHVPACTYKILFICLRSSLFFNWRNAFF